MKDESKIPVGDYCYDIISVDDATGRLKIKKCPYWSMDTNLPKQNNGYCYYLEYGDWEGEFVTHLWDKVKECGVNELDDVGFAEQIEGEWGR